MILVVTKRLMCENWHEQSSQKQMEHAACVRAGGSTSICTWSSQRAPTIAITMLEVAGVLT